MLEEIVACRSLKNSVLDSDLLDIKPYITVLYD